MSKNKKDKIIALIAQKFQQTPFSDEEKKIFDNLEQYITCRIILDERGVFENSDKLAYGTALLQLLPDGYLDHNGTLPDDRVLPTIFSRSSAGQVISFLAIKNLLSDNLPILEDINYPDGYFIIHNNKIAVCINSLLIELPDFIQHYLQSLN